MPVRASPRDDQLVQLDPPPRFGPTCHHPAPEHRALEGSGVAPTAGRATLPEVIDPVTAISRRDYVSL